MERLLRVASPLGLYAEEFDADTGRHLGNFPQAFSHLALIEAAAQHHPRRAPRGVHAMSEHYDVIMIGSGAGGGTLVDRLAPSGKRILLLERGDWLPREPAELGRATTSSSRTATCPPDTWYDSDGKPFQPQVHYFVGGARSSTARRCTGCAQRTSASCATTTASRPRGRSATTRWSPTTRRPSSSTRCTARAARTRPSRRRARPTRYPPVSHEPRIQQLSDDLEARGHHPFHAPCGVLLDEADLPYSHLRALRDLRRLPVPGAREGRRRGARRAAGA